MTRGPDTTLWAAHRWWDLAVATAVVVTGVATLALPAPATARPAGVWACLACIVAAYVLLGRRALSHEGSWQARTFGAVLIGAVTLGCAFNPSFAFVQFVVLPLLWMISTSTSTAVARNLALGVGVAGAYAVAHGEPLSGLATAVLSIGFSLAIGSWITRISVYGLERDRLLSELRLAQDRLATMERQAGAQVERERVAREIHDTVAQTLTGLVMLSQRTGSLVHNDQDATVRNIALIEEMATDALTEARALVTAWAPESVTGGLAEALRRITARFEQENGVRVDLRIEQGTIAREQEVVLLRCAQEGLANVRKHAGATSVVVRLAVSGTEALLEVRDDGVGLADAAAGVGGGFGLAGMRQRLALAQGSLAVGTAPEGGTALSVTVPVRTGAER